MTKTKNIKTNVLSYTIQNMDILYKLIIPFFQSMKFNSRKSFDFKIWSYSVKLRILGYHELKEGKRLLLKLSRGTNKYRYNLLKNFAPRGASGGPPAGWRIRKRNKRSFIFRSYFSN